MATKSSPKKPAPAPQVTTPPSASMPIIAMVLGVVSLVTFMWFLGIPAIILGIIGLKKYSENRGFSITGLVTGILSTLLMVGTAIFLFFLMLLAIVNADPTPSSRYDSNRDTDRYERRDNGDERDRLYRDDSSGI